MSLGASRASPNYFDLLEIPITSGRTFTSAEASGNVPVVVLSKGAADLLWPGQSALGRVVRLTADPLGRGPRRQTFPVAEVIGVGGVVANLESAFQATISFRRQRPRSATG
jgi:hypothetical protein